MTTSVSKSCIERIVRCNGTVFASFFFSLRDYVIVITELVSHSILASDYATSDLYSKSSNLLAMAHLFQLAFFLANIFKGKKGYQGVPFC